MTPRCISLANTAILTINTACQQKPFQINSVSRTIFFTDDTKLYEFNPSNNSTMFIGDMGMSMLDIAFNGVALYGITNATLYRINHINASVTSIGPTASANALVFDSTGILLGITISPTNLVHINVTNGNSTVIGLVGNSLYPDGDIAFDLNGTLFGSFNNGQIYRINPSTGIGTFIGASNAGSLWGMAYCNGILYGGTSTGEIVAINPSTGASSLIINLAGITTIHGMASVPTSPLCSSAPLPTLQPTISLRWGNGPNDKMETDDVEVLCITVCNPYNNVTFTDVLAFVTSILDSSGNTVANLPDGTPSVMIKPSGFICFGDLRPCRGAQAGCVSREIVLIDRGAMPGNYQVTIELCFGVSFDANSKETFILQLTAS